MSEKTTSNTYLYAKKSGETSFLKLIDITSYPDIFTAPEKIDVSDLSSNQKKYTAGMIDLPDYEFGYNYTKSAYDKVKALEGKNDTVYQIRFGENGEYGAWQWTGDIFVNVSGGDVGAKREGTITCYPETDITAAVIE
ncbi:MAG: hypothetical protein ACI4I9_01710 [Porcipelethomonas sp.]